MLSSRSSINTKVSDGPGAEKSDSVVNTFQPFALWGYHGPELFQPGPPTQLLIDMLRMRGTVMPLLLMAVVKSAGHFQMAVLLPQ